MTGCESGSRVIPIDPAQAPSDVASAQTATDNTGIVYITSDVNIESAIFTDTNITWTARDFEGNTATCVWIMSVQGLYS